MLEQCHDKAELYRFLSQSPELNLYSLGDLDDFFWINTRYYVSRNKGDISAVVVVYQTTELPIVMALGDQVRELSNILKTLLPTLGERIYCHLSFGCEQAISDDFTCTYSEHQGRMILRTPQGTSPHPRAIKAYGIKDKQRLADFYSLSYPSNWFDERMLNCHHFMGYVHNHQLVSVAGVHVYSPTYQVAALGNIATHPGFRGKGLATECINALCKALMTHIELIGLNVNTENTAAIRCYENAGFEMVVQFSEMMLEKK